MTQKQRVLITIVIIALLFPNFTLVLC